MDNSALTTKTAGKTAQIALFERKKKITVSIAEEYFLTRIFLRQILTNDKGGEFEVLNDFADTDDCINAAGLNRVPDVLMMNISFLDKNNIEKIKNIRMKYPDIKLLIITAQRGVKEIITCLELGVLGYILKNADKEIIKKAVKQVYSDKIFVDPSIVEDEKIKIAG